MADVNHLGNEIECDPEIVAALRQLTDILKFFDEKGWRVPAIHLNQAIEEVGLELLKNAD